MQAGITRSPIAARPPGWRIVERSVSLPASGVSGARVYLQSWALKRAAGFVVPDGPPVADAFVTIRAGVGRLMIDEPVVVIWVGDGFGYATREGHPLRGEESFILDAERCVFTVRSISRPASPGWGILSPVLRIMQNIVVWRYLRAVSDAAQASSVPAQDVGK